MERIPQPPPTDEMVDELVLAFAPVHKRAFGMAVGIVAGTMLALVTLYAVVKGEHDGILPLLAIQLAGYSVSAPGVLVGFAWGWFAGFVAGWFLAFTRNLAVAGSVWMARTRAELRATRDFLDHI